MRFQKKDLEGQKTQRNLEVQARRALRRLTRSPDDQVETEQGCEVDAAAADLILAAASMAID